MASAMEKALIKQGMPDKTARKEAKARIEAMKIAKIRKQEKRKGLTFLKRFSRKTQGKAMENLRKS